MSYFDAISTDLVMKSSTIINKVTTNDIVRRVVETYELPDSFLPIVEALTQCDDSPKLRHWVSVSRSLLRSKIQVLDPEPRFISHFFVDSLDAGRIVEIHAFRALEIVIEDCLKRRAYFEWQDEEVWFPPSLNLWKIGTIHANAPIKGVKIRLDQGHLSIQSRGSKVEIVCDVASVHFEGDFAFTSALLASTCAGDFVVPIDVSGLADSFHSNAPVVRGLGANKQWIGIFQNAMTLLHEQAPSMAADCAVLSPAVLALHTGGTSYGSSSPQEIMGLIFLPGIDAPYDLAECLLHESLHQKLYRVEEGAPLFQDGKDEEEKYYSPWRSDGRPLRMLVHGAYVFAGVSHYWRANHERLTDADDRENASFQCYYRAKQAESAMAIVDKFDFRTAMGSKVSEIIKEGIDSALSGMNLSPSVLKEAHERLDQHRARFGKHVH